MAKWKKMLGIFMAGAVLVTGGTLPQNNAATAAEEKDYGISNPRTENGVTTWDKIKFGSYYQDAEIQPAEPIKWRVLSVDGDDAFLIADRNLDCKKYNEEDTDVTWETCTLRKWLNEDFYNGAFDDEEKKAVKETVVINEDNPEYGTEGGSDTTDKVYLLSISEACNADYGFDTTFNEDSKTREAENTDYAKANGGGSSSYSGTAGNGYWWLRSPGFRSNDAARVGDGGCGDNYGTNVDYSGYAVRPALHINLSSSKVKDAGEVDSAGNVTVLGDGIQSPRIEDGLTTWDCVYFGSYRQNFSVKQDIEWRVLSVDGDDAFLLADKNLDAKPYNEERADVTWETCTLRKWLNGDFYNGAFDEEERKAVIETAVINEDNPYYGTEGGSDTTDKVYLLSISEASNAAYGFDTKCTEDSKTREAKNTDYAKMNGAATGASSGIAGNGYWWLRSSGSSSKDAVYVGSGGYGICIGSNVGYSNNAVRPALHINLSSTSWSKASEVSSEEQGDDNPSASPSPTPSVKPDATAKPTKQPDETQFELPLESMKENVDAFKVGTFINYAHISDKNFTELAKQQFDIVTFENEMKGVSLLDVGASASAVAEEGESVVKCRFDRADEMIKWAKDNGLKVRGHVLFCERSMAEAFFYQGYEVPAETATEEEKAAKLVDADTFKTRMKNYAEQVITHFNDKFPDMVIAWDVVNDAVDGGDTAVKDWTTGLYLNNTGNFYRILGGEYIKLAFEYAKAAVAGTGKDIQLFYNDFNCFQSPKTQRITDLIKYLNADEDNRLLDCMGMEGFVLTYWPAASDVKKAMETFANLGVKVGINELSIRLSQQYSADNTTPVTDADIEAHARKCEDMFKVYRDFAKNNPGILSNVSIRTLTDRPDLESEAAKPEEDRVLDYAIYGTHSGLFTADYKAKEAFYRVMDVFRDGNPRPTAKPTPTSAATPTPKVTASPAPTVRPDVTATPTRRPGGTDYGISNPRTENGVTTWDKVKFGSYYQDAKIQPAEPIKWRVLSVDGDNAFLIADKNLDAKPYNEEGTDVTWETCTLRKWLNEDFYNEAFDAEEKKAVIETTVINEDNPYYGTEGGSDTTDKVYLLSISEACNADYGFDTEYRQDSKTREAKNTDYAKVNNVQSDYASVTAGNGYWWLRSPDDDRYVAAYVNYSGSGGNYGEYVDDSNIAVRPALHINLSSSKVKDAGEVDSAGNITASGDGIKSPRIEDGVTTWDCVYFGNYRQSCEFTKQDIEWRVLSVDGEDAFLLADKNLDAKMYNNEKRTDVTWEICTLREWLNGEFYNEAFDAEEKKAIKETVVTNEDDPLYNTEGGNDTKDKVYLLSTSETDNALYGFRIIYVKDFKIRKAKNTDYAKMNNVRSNQSSVTAGNGYWWLRSPGDRSSRAAYVDCDGVHRHSNFYVEDSIHGVRPALHINLSSASWSKAGEVSSEEQGDDNPSASPSPTPSVKPDATAEPTKQPEETEKPDATAEPTKQPDATQNPDATATPSQTPSVTAQPTPPMPTESPAPSEAPVLKTIKLSGVKCVKNAKKITGKVSVKSVAVRIKVGKKAYKKASVKGKKFTLKLNYRLKKKTKVTVRITKEGYKPLVKLFKVK